MDANSPELDWLVSVDDHVIEPPNVWVDRLPAKYRDIGPRMLEDDAWVYEDKRVPTTGLSVTIGKSKEEFSPDPVPFSEMPPGRLRPGRPGGRHGPGRNPRRRCASPRFPVSVARSSGRPRTKNSLCSASRPTTTG